MYELTVEIPFSAAHCIPGHPGRCARLHGHSYRALVTVGGPDLDAQGMLMDFGALKEICSQVIAPLDHVYLNELPGFVSSPPTAERIARHIYGGVSALLAAHPGGGAAIVQVVVYESERSYATYQE
jgi:6-pyruvoyltetrahydropterin/6-carboxytetrahydropterin synthase